MSGAKPNLPCVFPFRFDGQVFNRCVSLQGEKPWCSTHTNAFGVHVTGNWGDCDKNSCPLAWINIHIISTFQLSNYSSWLSIPVNTVFTHVAKLNQDINYVVCTPCSSIVVLDIHYIPKDIHLLYLIYMIFFKTSTLLWSISHYVVHVIHYFFYKISYTILCMRYTKLWRIYIML